MNYKRYPDATHMRLMGDLIKELIPNDFAFVLLVAPFEAHKLANYISNGNRQDIIKFMRETADRLEKGTDYKTPENN